MTDSPEPRPRGRALYRITLACSALTTLVVVAFFFIGIADGSVSSFNLGLWLVVLSVMAASLWAGHAAQVRARPALAIAALSVTAVPGLLAALFMLVVMVSPPRWN